MADDRAKPPRPDDDPREPSYDIQTRYLAEIGRYELLTPEEEVELGRRMAEGDDEARRRMINSNLRLVVTIAKRYSRGGQNLLDLIEDGNLGLIRAASKFDYTRGFRFSTYASYWIKQSIKRGIAGQSRAIRIPVHIYHLINKYLKKEEELKAAGKRIDDESMAEALDISMRRVKLTRTLIAGIRAEDPGASADALMSLAADPQRRTVHTPEALVTLQLEHQEMSDLFDRCLSPREQEILTLRYGLDDGEPRTLGEAGRIVGVSRERVRQIEKRALQKLNLVLSGGRRRGGGI
ncbi:MAG TPA: RNA polymerase sigma factor RpoD/SigA [Candidatus Krumholzibacteria bacterium]|nr:RNA polymerase sigma factor RpoD/SigA [Candidatus Krumholzibacteria bacterium]